MKTQVLLLLIISLFYSCQTLKIDNRAYQKTEYNVALGNLGYEDIDVIGKTYNSNGNIQIESLKISCRPVEFTKASYSAYLESKNYQSAKVAVQYVDSLDTKPYFLNMILSDKIGLINLLNEKSNIETKNYLINQSNTKVVTRISIVFNNEDMETLMNADEIFIQTNDLDTYEIKAYHNSELKKTIKFTDGVVFAYDTGNCCWKANSKFNLDIIDIVEGKDCPSKSYIWPSKAQSKINYYKL